MFLMFFFLYYKEYCGHSVRAQVVQSHRGHDKTSARLPALFTWTLLPDPRVTYLCLDVALRKEGQPGGNKLLTRGTNNQVT